MRRTLATLAILIFSFCFLCLNPGKVYGFKIEFVKGIEFEEGSESEIKFRSFCVAEDGLFLIPDYQAGTIKTFDQDEMVSKLKFAKKFGIKGFGSDEFNRPAYCFYDNYSSKFVVSDIGKGSKKVFIYDRIGGTDFKRIYKIPGADCYDMRLGGDGNQLIVSGYVTDKDKKSYELYSINLENPKQKDFLLPSYQKYHLANDEEYQIEYFEKRTLPAKGIRAFIDVYGDDVYFVWEAKFKIIKINLKTKDEIIFGQATKDYKEPSASAELVKAHRDRDYTRVWQERRNMSFVRDIFATSWYIFVVFDGPGQGNFRMQVYTPEGEFLDEMKIPKSHPYREMWLDKQSYTLYSLSRTGNNDKPQILIYKVKVNE
ncbi:hypothetical protein ACFLRT_03390 [Acidobacteriota bacterium]